MQLWCVQILATWLLKDAGGVCCHQQVAYQNSININHLSNQKLLDSVYYTIIIETIVDEIPSNSQNLNCPRQTNMFRAPVHVSCAFSYKVFPRVWKHIVRDSKIVTKRILQEHIRSIGLILKENGFLRNVFQ